MTARDKADLRLNCFYAAITITGANRSASSITKGEKEEPTRTIPTTEKILGEAKKISKWVTGRGR